MQKAKYVTMGTRVFNEEVTDILEVAQFPRIKSNKIERKYWNILIHLQNLVPELNQICQS